MFALSMGKKRELRIFLRMLVMTIWAVSMVTILASCGSSPGYSYTISGVISGMAGSGMVLQNNGGDDLNISTNGAFSFNTAMSNGSAYSITVKEGSLPTTPPQKCVVSNGSGSINGAPVSNVVVSCVMNSSSSVTVDPLGRFAYVTDVNNVNIHAYTIDQVTTPGALIAVSGSPFAAGTHPNPVTIDPTGNFAYVSNMGDNTIWAYTIDQTAGATYGKLNFVQSVSTNGTSPSSVTVESSGQFAYVANVGSSILSAYKIDTDSSSTTYGQLTLLQTLTAGLYPMFVTVYPDPLSGETAKFAYVPNMGDSTTSGSVSAYSINSDGTLTAVTGATAGTKTISVTVDPLGRFAYASNWGSSNISAYLIGADGSLTLLQTTDVVCAYPNSVTIDPTGGFAYVSFVGDGTQVIIQVYSINQTAGSTYGQLIPLQKETLTTAGLLPNPVKIIPIGGNQFAYVSNAVLDSTTAGTILVYSINSDGTLTLLQTVSLAAGISLTSVTIDPNGPFAYVSDINSNTVYAYTIGTDGKLTSAP
jgi:6-phosphogluconolactonase